MIRAGILLVPEWDENTITQLRTLLRASLPEAVVVEETIAQNQRNWIGEILRNWVDEDELDLILTVGGTYPAPGLSATEIVPEATEDVVERLLPSLPETMRAVAAEETELALLDRGIAGIRGRSLIINLPHGAAPAYLFFGSIISVVPAILAHLQLDATAPRIDDELEIVSDGEIETAQTSNQKTGSNPNKKGLDPAEFTEFLRKQSED